MAPATFSGDAVDRFGQESVQDAYAIVAAVSDQMTFNENLMTNNPNRTVSDFDAASAYWTPRMTDDFHSLVQRSLPGDADAQESLMAISFNDVLGPNNTFPTSGPIVTNHTISDATASLDSTGLLVLTVTEHGDVHMLRDGAPVTFSIDKTADYHLVESGAGWLVDAIAATWTNGAAIPE